LGSGRPDPGRHCQGSLIQAAIATASQPLSVQDRFMERSDLLIAFLAFGAAVMSLGAWLWSSLGERDG
jgi:hypothetical protein